MRSHEAHSPLSSLVKILLIAALIVAGWIYIRSTEKKEQQREQALKFLAAGDTQRNAGLLSEAVTSYSRAAYGFLAIGAWQEQAQAQSACGNTLLLLKQTKQAAERFAGARAIYRQQKDKKGEAYALSNLAYAAQSEGDLDKARAYYQEAMTVAQGVDASAGAAARAGLGDLAASEKNFNEAERYYGAALVIYQSLGEKGNRGAAGMYRLLGLVEFERKDLGKAVKHFKASLSRYDIGKNRNGQAELHRLLGDVASERAEVDEAQARYKQALSLYQELRDATGQAGIWMRLGVLAHEHTHDPETALTAYDRGLRVLPDDIDLLCNRAEALFALGRFSEFLDGLRSIVDAGDASCKAGLSFLGWAAAVLSERTDEAAVWRARTKKEYGAPRKHGEIFWRFAGTRYAVSRMNRLPKALSEHVQKAMAILEQPQLDAKTLDAVLHD